MILFSIDVSVFFDWFLSMMISGVTTTFNILDTIQFHGISLLDFCLAMILIPTGLSIFVAIAKVSTGVASVGVRAHELQEGFGEAYDDMHKDLGA